MFSLSSQYHDKCSIYCKTFASVKKRCANREETLIDMCRVLQTRLLGYRPSPNKPHEVDHICIMWSNAISVRTSAIHRDNLE